MVEQVPPGSSPGRAERPGFRAPQKGATYAVLGYWTTDPTREATVVMPTGTGKTDTMVALYAAALPERLLVLVPSDALRTQLAETFERYGILERIGVLGEGPLTYPVVGRLSSGLKSVSDARKFARRCNVVVATPQALNASSEPAQAAFVSMFSHLFVDEAHHVKATTWDAVRSQFAEGSVVQFTATPYREDRRELGGKLVYVFPLGLAQRQGYFSTINYRGIRVLGDEDHAIAAAALDQLQSDLAEGRDHVIMARVRRKARADEVVKIYRELAPEFEPTVLYSGLKPMSAKRAALSALHSRATRVVVCVDMLGEGFDLPALKIAAIHDPHKSLGITLQFIGRFARVASDVGAATVVVGRPDSLHDENLRALYSEDPDWNVIIRDLSEGATEAEEAAAEFSDGFDDAPPEIAAHDITPKMSAVAYRTKCSEWDPQAAVEHIGPQLLLTNPIPHNKRVEVAWFVKRTEEAAEWAPRRGLVDVEHELFAMYWDRQRSLLFINSSNNESSDRHHQRLAEAVAGNDVERIRGAAVFRVYGGIQRLVATNVGVLDVLNRARKFTMHAGSDALSHYPSGDAQTKTQTNLFAHGYANGEREFIGASVSGRIWSWRAAGSLREWMVWCDGMGRKLIDDRISLDEIIANFILPEQLSERPELVVLAIEWPASAYRSTSGDLRVRHAGSECALIDAELLVTEFTTSGPVRFDIMTENWRVAYQLMIGKDGMRAVPESSETVSIVTTRRECTLEDYVQDEGLSLLLERDAVIEPPGLLLQPNVEVAGFPRAGLRTHVDWAGVDLTLESQGATKNPVSIQRRVIDTMLDHGTTWLSPSGATGPSWDVVIDDDGPNELADVVALRRDGDHLEVQLVHCKYSSKPLKGARIEDLYEVCGQASKSVGRRRELSLLVDHLVRRETLRQQRGRSGFEVGTPTELYEIADHLNRLKLKLTIVIVQPGLSVEKVSSQQLDLLASTEMYVYQVGGASFEVVVNT
ncbi:MAG: DEAD/DEAH box helicase family protein [Acidimicrobiaceae bacterium]|nr:DEAD/DEAH box helicase family protein [Acidimicrobiaceae bacterium]MDE0515132.1 DEAD/DEAH box helicase family protein [Acidimicrobiaceae bacterium]